MREIERIAARTAGRLAIDVIFCLPDGAPSEWREGELPTLAAGIAGVVVRFDPAGREARRFAATTSGAALLFDPEGRLRFRGGLTSARGHEGDNAGKSAVLSYVLAGRDDVVRTPVFGCPLFDETAEGSP